MNPEQVAALAALGEWPCQKYNPPHDCGPVTGNAPLPCGPCTARAASAAGWTLTRDDLGAAWARVEAALPKGQWMLELVKHGIGPGDVNPRTGVTITAYEQPYSAIAQRHWVEGEATSGDGSTPTAALLALAEKLQP